MVNSLVSTPGPEEVAARLRAAAASAPKGSVALLPGLTDEELDSWEAPVPEEIRILLRRTSGLRITSGVREKHFGPAHPVNSAPEDPNHLCSGDPGTFRVVHVDDGTGDTYYVDVDPATGAWGRVFSFHVEVISEVVAPSLLHWLEDLSDYVSRASSETAKGYFTSFREAFNAWFFGDFSEAGPGYPHQDPAVLARQREPVDVDPLDVPTARALPDPDLAAVARHLPDKALLADLRDVPAPAWIPFEDHPDWYPPAARYRRFHGSDFLAAIPWPE
ncbi:SMI1/KNR4 family protein [Thermobifida halotolerans]|uniref:SMI1/KNR4 family protein n=1 Tax=Thermobifida halotolerans TaxID=483545 RepID=A0AA97LW10_9ACTN|nr:SMI1/KNR4 family protein [Thermobifida halotolerans]UOE19114.1 SMI1/KNR4 family protein [Thermobifida halotolerans]